MKNNQTKFKETELGPIPEDWEVLRLRELLINKGYIRGPFGSALRRPEMKTSGIPVYEQQNAIYNHRDFRFFIDSNKYSELKRFTVNPNDIIISCSGTLGKTTIIKEGDPEGIISQALLLLRPNTKLADPKFLNYFLSSDEGQGSLKSRSHGSVQTNIAKREDVENIQLIVPSLPEQQKIAEVLGALDDKIELNRKMNKTLEQIAQAIFKKWFNNNSHLEQVVKLGDVLETIESGRRPKGGVAQYKEGIPSIGAENINGLANYSRSKNKFIPELFFKSMRTGLLKNKDVLLYKDGALIGRKTIYRNNFPYTKCCINEHVFILRTKDKKLQNFLYFWLDQREMTESIINLNSNAAQPGINQEQVRSLKIIVPNNSDLENIDNQFEIILEKIYENAKEIETLSQIRDSLLPRLMSGKLRVR